MGKNNIKVYFKNFSKVSSGTIVSEDKEFIVVRAKNPYGSHSLVALTGCDGSPEYTSFIHGKGEILHFLKFFNHKRLYRSLIKKINKRKNAG